MEPREIIDEIKLLIDDSISRGQNVIYIHPFKKYLESLSSGITDSADQRRRAHESSLAEYTAKTQFNVEMFKSVLEAGKTALHTLLLINGGAVVALLGILSNLANNPSARALAHGLALPLLQFGIGVFVGALALAFRYCSQACYASTAGDKDAGERGGQIFTVASILSGLAGFILFVIGVVNAYHAIQWHFAP